MVASKIPNIYKSIFVQFSEHDLSSRIKNENGVENFSWTLKSSVFTFLFFFRVAKVASRMRKFANARQLSKKSVV